MKLRILLLTAALVFSASTAFAANDKMNGNKAKSILNELDLVAQPSYSWDIVQVEGMQVDSSILNITMVRMNGNQNKVETGWRYSVGGYATSGDSLWKTTVEDLSDSNGTHIDKATYNASLIAAGLTEKQVEAIDFYADNHSGFKFEVSFDEPTEKYGLIGKEGGEVESISNTANDEKRMFYTVGSTNVLYYGYFGEEEDEYPNNGAFFIVSLNTTYQEKEIGAGGGSGSNGQPLPAPIVTLLIALGFGAVLVYRRKQARA